MINTIEKNPNRTLLFDYIMFNLVNTNSYSKKSKLQAILKNGLRQQKGNHTMVIRKNNLFNCFSYGIKEICAACGTEIAHPVYCLDYKLCAICNRNYANKRGQKIYETFELFNTEYMIHDVLTIHRNYFSKELDKFDIMNELNRLSSLYLYEVYGEKTSGVRVVHTWSTKNPLGPPHFHIHLLISDKKYYPIHQKTLSGDKHIVGFGKKEMKVYQEDLQKLRDTWKKILGYPGEVNLYHQYSNKAGKKRHLCRYISRHAVYDINEFLWKKGKYYKMSPEEEKNFDYQMQNKKYFKRIRYFGEYSDSKRANLYYTIHKKNIQNAYSPKKYLELCPNCGEILSGYLNGMVEINEKTKFPIVISEEEYEFQIKRLKK
ncbi:hypothetical protein ES703_84921 [subsurface metagenome]